MISWVGVKKGFRALSQFHENEKIIRWVQGLRIVAWLTPKRRRVILALGAVLAGGWEFYKKQTKPATFLDPTPWISHALAIPILFVLLYIFFLLARDYTTLPEPLKHRPQLFLHILFWALLLLMWWTPDLIGRGKTVFVLIVVTFPLLLWRIGYMLKTGQRGKATQTSFADHLFYLSPVWGDGAVVYGKGLDYLSQHEAQTTEAYARAILAGAKLLCLGVLWLVVNKLILKGFVYGDADPGRLVTFLLGEYRLGLPRVTTLMIGEEPYSPFLAWVSLYVELVKRTISLAIHGHFIIGILRICGFNVFRNTYKPLLSETLLDFWHRYHHYFKELLVQFFFFPTYLRYFRTKPILRIFVATFAAAFLGNMYFHIIIHGGLYTGNLGTVWHDLSPRLLYCFLLATGIFVSMIRQQKQRGRPAKPSSWWGQISRVRKIAGVWTFYSLIHIANWGGGDISLLQRYNFFLSLFGM